MRRDELPRARRWCLRHVHEEDRSQKIKRRMSLHSPGVLKATGTPQNLPRCHFSKASFGSNEPSPINDVDTLACAASVAIG